jgi:rubrerythrin
MTKSPQRTGREAEPISGVDDFLTHAYMIELEARDRYEDLADQMDMHNNPDAAKLLHTLAHAEGKHLDEIVSRLKGRELATRAAWEYRWHGMESPESADISELHYLMTPFHILQIALKGEQRALEFFAAVAEETTDDGVRALATEMADEERAHVRMVEEMLETMPEPPEDWDEDLSPPTAAD